MSEIQLLPRILILDKEAVFEDLDGYVSMEMDAVEAVRKLIEGFGKALVVDLNGVRTNRPRLDFIKELEKKPIWVDGGARLADNAIDLFIAGAERVVLRTKTLVSMNELRKAYELSDQLVFQVDVTGGRSISGSNEFAERTPEQLIRDVARMGVKSCLYIDKSGSIPSPSSITHGLPDGFELFLGMLHQSDSSRFEDTAVSGIIVDAKELM